ncbi:type IV pilus modification protein PilV [Gammaproteobacteria bacterium 45_16_T64]|nr:type IV pilus modification protein PilV [Gammaproteobacteria bacterium 45_16_T64]
MKRHGGWAFIEVLIAILVLGVGSAGLVAIQIQTLSVANDAYYRSQALGIAQDIIERIKANPRGWPSLYDGQEWKGEDKVSKPPCYQRTLPKAKMSGCTSAKEISNFDHFEISQLLSVSLPDATVFIRLGCDGAKMISCVVISWGGMRVSSCDVSPSSMAQVKEHRCMSMRFVGFSQ